LDWIRIAKIFDPFNTSKNTAMVTITLKIILSETAGYQFCQVPAVQPGGETEEAVAS